MFTSCTVIEHTRRYFQLIFVSYYSLVYIGNDTKIILEYTKFLIKLSNTGIPIDNNKTIKRSFDFKISEIFSKKYVNIK